MADTSKTKVYKGWLQTREGENYAPKTVIEGVYEASSGKLYDKVIKEYIDNKVKDVNPTVATLQTTVATHTTEISNLKSADNALNSSIDAIEKSIENIQDDGSDALYITDNSGYKIAQIDKYGIHSVEVHNKDTSLGAVADRMAAAETQLSNIADGNLSANDDTFYIIDQYDNIIAKIDQDGITSTDFIIKNGEEFSSLLELINNNQSGIIRLRDELQEALNILTNRVSGLETSVSEIRDVIDTSDSSDTFYIIDKDNNIIAKIDGNGVHSIDFLVEENDNGNVKIVGRLKELLTTIGTNADNISSIAENLTNLTNRVGATETAITNNATNIQTNTEAIAAHNDVFNIEDDKVLYILDNNGNKLAQFDEDGFRAWKIYEGTSNLSITEYTDEAIKAAKNIIETDKIAPIETKLGDYDTYKNKVDTLIDEDINKSVREIAFDETSKVVGNAPEKLKTIESITTWLDANKDGVVDLSVNIAKNTEDININKNAISALQTATNGIENINLGHEGSFVLTDDTNESNKIFEVDSQGASSINFIIPADGNSPEGETRVSGSLSEALSRLNIVQGNSEVTGSITYYIKASREWAMSRHKILQDYIDDHDSRIGALETSFSEIKAISTSDIDKLFEGLTLVEGEV